MARFLWQALDRTKTIDPVFMVFNRIYRDKGVIVPFSIGIAHIGLWIGISTIVLKAYPTTQVKYFSDLDEFSFGFFVWGIFVPTLWWYYLSLPRIWDDTVNALHSTGLVVQKIKNIIPERSFTIVSLIISALVGALYLWNLIPAETSSGRESFWFVTDWTKGLLTVLIAANSYVFVNFVLDTLLVSRRMSSFFNEEGVVYVQVFHIDGCGGFGVMGDLAMRLSSLVILVGIWAVWVSLLPRLTGGRPNLGIGVLLIFVGYAILAPLILLSLTWPAHRAMRKYKLDYRKRVCNELEKTFNTIAASTFKQACDKEGLDESLARYRNLVELSGRVDSLPDWPISFGDFKRFTGLATLPGLIGLASFLFDFGRFLQGK